MKPQLIFPLLLILISGTLYSQSTSTDSTKSVSAKILPATPNATVIKWTKQLPEPVTRTFFKSPFSNWYIEKMIRYRSDGKTAYRFIVNNGNLLDADHHDSFLKTDSLDISDTGAILN